jgi:uncharacterized protein YggE
MNIRYALVGVFAVLALGAATGAARCQDNISVMPTAVVSQGITATGHSELKVKPDIALVTITVTTQSQHQEDAVQENAVKTTAVLSALKDVKIAEKDIQTQSYTVQPQYDYTPSPPVLTGYQVQNSVQVTVRDLTQVGLVIDKTTAGGASEIGGVSFDLSDRSQAESQALSQAVLAAKSKAGVMASAAGVDLGRLLSINEGTSAPPPVRPMFMSAMRAKAADVPETPIADQQITVTADATLVYAMGGVR